MAETDPKNPEDGATAVTERLPRLMIASALIVVIACAITFGVLACVHFLMRTEHPGAIDTLSKFGDAFAILNTAFSGFAFAAVTLTLFGQREELRLQRQELAMQRKEMTANTEAQKAQHDAMIASARIAVITELIKVAHERIKELEGNANASQEKRNKFTIALAAKKALQVELRKTYGRVSAGESDEPIRLLETAMQ